MKPPDNLKVLKIRYKSTHCYFIVTKLGILAFDAGWPNTYAVYKDLIKKEGCAVDDIKWLVVSHFHMDHAGLAGMLVDHGVRFIVFTNQVYALEEMEQLIARKGKGYHKIDLSKACIMDLSGSREWLHSIGLEGEVIKTNGHGEHSVTLLLDSGEAFIGDLPPEYMAGDDGLCRNNWKELKSRGARMIYPSHAPEYELK